MLFLNESLNHESTSRHVLLISVKDNGDPRRTGHTHVIITVHDFNEYAPQFLPTPIPSPDQLASFTPLQSSNQVSSNQMRLYGIVLSSVPIGSVAYRVLAFDTDRGENARISFTMLNKDKWTDHFSLNPRDGVITTKASLLSLEGRSLDIEIEARDNGQPIRSNRTTLSMRIQSASPISAYTGLSTAPPTPRFSTNQIQVTIRENVPRDTIVTSVEAFMSPPCYCPIFYRLMTSHSLLPSVAVPGVSEWRPEDLFEVIKTTGQILTKTILDRERHGDVVNIVVESFGQENRVGDENGRIKIEIRILDENDNAPTFPNLQPLVGYIKEDAVHGSIVKDLRGFALVMRASDPDKGLNGMVKYIVESSPHVNHFRVDNTTGAIRVSNTLDRENISIYHLRITAVDSNPDPTQVHYSPNSANVTIHIEDVSDTPPVFIKPSTEQTVAKQPVGQSETIYNPDVVDMNARTNQNEVKLLLPTFPGAEVYQVVVEDKDLNDKINYTIVSGNDSPRHFHLNSSSGLLTVSNDRIDRDLSFHLVLEANDGVFKVRANLTVLCQHLTGRPLSLVQSKINVSIEENSPPGIILAIVKVEDSAPNAVHHFTILTPTPFIEIGEFSGVIRTSSLPMDKEITTELNLVILVRDPDQRFAHARVIVEVKDQNDEAPVFVGRPYHTVFFIDSRPGDPEVSTKITAIDRDSGFNGTVRYSLDYIRPFADLSMFALNSQSGQLSLASGLSPDWLGKKMQIGVIARDQGSPIQYSSSAVVSVQIASHLSPLFLSPHYQVTIPENLEPGQPIITVNAESSSGATLLYTIAKGYTQEIFALDFNTEYNKPGPCVIRLVERLDFETKKAYNLTIMVTDTANGLSTNVEVAINVTDVNDNAPVFSKTEYSISISEMTQIGTKILQISANDTDTGINAQIIFSLEEVPSLSQKSANSPSSTQLFAINTVSGWITVIGQLDYESHREHKVWVVARNAALPVLSSKALVKIELLDYNDNPPKFDQSEPSNVSISDQSQSGSVVASVRAIDRDFNDHLTYSLHPEMSDAQFFSIDSSTGLLRFQPTANMITNNRTFKIVITASDGVHATSHSLSVSLLPSNHYTPQFLSPFHQVSVREDLSVDSVVARIPPATDHDTGIFGQITYSIPHEVDRNWFSINPSTAVVSLRRSLDRESRDLYKVLIQGQDGGGRVAFLVLTVHVLDVNDNKPAFQQNKYEVTLLLNTPTDSPFLNLTAHDADINDVITYRISTQMTSENDAARFRVDPITGGVYIVSSNEMAVDTDSSTPIGHIFVEACDQVELCSIPVPIIIYFIGRELDYPLPQIRCSVNQLIETIAFTYESPQDVALCSVTPSIYTSLLDGLAGRSGVSGEWRLVPGFQPATNSEGTFKINRVHGTISADQILDYERIKSYNITVLFRTTKTTPPLFATTTLRIDIQDINDWAPQFSSRSFSVSVPENLPSGTRLIQTSASDPDKDGTDSVTYSIQFPDDLTYIPPISIDPKTGWVSVADGGSLLDREEQERLIVRVVAKDAKGLTNETTITLTLLDVNDSPLKWPVPAETTVEILENNLAVPVTLLRLRTLDADSTDRPPVRFYLLPSSASPSPLNLFSMSSEGLLEVIQPLDRERGEWHRLEVMATDGVFTTQTPFTVMIKVIDVNDNWPICQPSPITVSNPESLTPGSLIATLTAHDTDASPTNSRLSFTLLSANTSSSMTSQDDSSLFALDPMSGALTTASPMDRERTDNHLLLINVTDSGGLWCTIEVRCLWTDVNDNKPKFTSSSSLPALLENAPVESLVGKIHAEDADLGPNRRIRYSLVDSDSSFSIDRISGLVKVARPLDREKTASHTLVVMATDTGSPVALSSSATVQVRLLDVNDSPPEFVQSHKTVFVSEELEVGEKVAQVTAISRDEGVNAMLSYRIVGTKTHFNLDPNSGVLTLASPLNYEHAQAHFITIEAKDKGVPPLSSTSVLTVSVLDVNDNVPTFPQNIYNFTVIENEGKGRPVGKIAAIDPDSGNNGRLTYSLIPSSSHPENTFRLDPATGQLNILINPDRETVDRYEMQVVVKDEGTPQLSSTATIVVRVEDLNDNPPVFDKESYVFVVQVDRDGNITSHPRLKSGSGTEIGRIRISDKDAPPNGAPFSCVLRQGPGNSGSSSDPFSQSRGRGGYQYSFSVRNVSDNECILVASGRLRVGGQSLNVQVNDNGQTSLTAQTTVLINVVRQSNIPPEIVQVNVTLTYYQLARPVGEIVRVAVHDRTPYDRLDFRLTSPFGDLFTIGRENGTIYARRHLDSGVYPLTIRIANGSLASESTIYVTAFGITEEMVRAASIVRIQDLHPKLFFTEEMDKTLKVAINKAMTGEKTESKNYRVYILSVQENRDNQFYRPVAAQASNLLAIDSDSVVQRDRREVLTNQNAGNVDGGMLVVKQSSNYVSRHATDVLIAVYDVKKRTFVDSKEVASKINAVKENLSKQFSSSVSAINDLCNSYGNQALSCGNGECITVVSMATDRPANRVEVHKVTQVAPRFELKTQCLCRPNFMGSQCTLASNECANRPCKSPKLCVPRADQWGPYSKQYQCVCPPLLTGDRCQIPVADSGSSCFDRACVERRENGPLVYSGSAFSNWTINKPRVDRVEIEMTIKTRQTEGPVLKYRWNSLRTFSIHLTQNGHLAVAPSLSQSVYTTPLWLKSQHPINNGTWHTVRLLLVSASPQLANGVTSEIEGLEPWWIQLTVDGIAQTTTQLDWQEGAEDVQYLLLGADADVISGSDIHFKHSFTGCIQNLLINNQRVPHQAHFSTASISLLNSQSLQFSCSDAYLAGTCGDTPCHHGGTCSPSAPRAFSSLAPLSGPVVGLQGVREFTCRCRQPFTGYQCEINTQPCSNKPCLYGGSCIAAPDNNFICTCPIERSGYLCENGPFCPINPALSPCKNSAVCKESPTGPVCICPPGFRGARCHLDIDECSEKGGLCNGKGVCQNLRGSFRCQCNLGYSGRTCENQGLTRLNADSNSLGLTQLHVYIIVGLLAFLFLAALCTIMVLVCRYRRPRGSHSHHTSLYDLRRRQASFNDLEKDSARIQMLPMQLGPYSRTTSHCSLASSSVARQHQHMVHHPYRMSMVSAGQPASNYIGYGNISPPTTPSCSLHRGSHQHLSMAVPLGYTLQGHHMHHPHHRFGGSITTASDRLSPCSSVATLTDGRHDNTNGSGGRGGTTKRPHHLASTSLGEEAHTGSSSQEGSDEMNNPTPVNNNKKRRRTGPLGPASRPPKPPHTGRPMSCSMVDPNYAHLHQYQPQHYRGQGMRGAPIDPNILNNMDRSGDLKMELNRKSLSSLDPSTCCDNTPAYNGHSDGYHWDMSDLQRPPGDIPDVVMPNGRGISHYQFSDDGENDSSLRDEEEEVISEVTSFLPPDVTSSTQRGRGQHERRVPLAACDDDEDELDQETLKRGETVQERRLLSRSPLDPSHSTSNRSSEGIYSVLQPGRINGMPMNGQSSSNGPALPQRGASLVRTSLQPTNGASPSTNSSTPSPGSSGSCDLPVDSSGSHSPSPRDGGNAESEPSAQDSLLGGEKKS